MTTLSETMKMNFGKTLIAFFSMLAAGFLMSCQTQETTSNPDIVLNLKLNDSLSRYDNVVITLVDRNDTTKVLDSIWSGPLAVPSQIAPITVKNAVNLPFIVMVRGYAIGGQLALETMIYWEDQKKSVVHQTVPDLIPRNFLSKIKTTSGTMYPPFSKDSTNYKVIVPLGVQSLTLNASPLFIGATVVANGDTLTPTHGYLSAKINNSGGYGGDSISIVVTDVIFGKPYSKTYTVITKPTEPPLVQLKSLVPSVGTLSPDFTPDGDIYGLHLSKGDSNVTFVMTPVDVKNTTMFLNGDAIFAGETSKPIAVASGTSEVAAIRVILGSVEAYYQVTIDRP